MLSWRLQSSVFFLLVLLFLPLLYVGQHIGRVRDQDRRELLLSLSLFARGVGWVVEIAVVDAKDAKWRGLHAGVRSLLIALVFL